MILEYIMDQAVLNQLRGEIESALAALDKAELVDESEVLQRCREAAERTHEQGLSLLSAAVDEAQRASIEGRLFILGERLMGVNPSPSPAIRPPDDD